MKRILSTVRKLSTVQAAGILGLQSPNLQRLIRQGRVKAPPLVKVGNVRVRLWSPSEVESVRRELGRNRARNK